MVHLPPLSQHNAGHSTTDVPLDQYVRIGSRGKDYSSTSFGLLSTTHYLFQRRSPRAVCWLSGTQCTGPSGAQHPGACRAYRFCCFWCQFIVHIVAIECCQTVEWEYCHPAPELPQGQAVVKATFVNLRVGKHWHYINTTAIA